MHESTTMHKKNSDFLVNLNSGAHISTAKFADLTILAVAALATWFIELKLLVVLYFSYANRYGQF